MEVKISEDVFQNKPVLTQGLGSKRKEMYYSSQGDFFCFICLSSIATITLDFVRFITHWNGMRKVFYFPNLAYGIGMRIFTFCIWKTLAKQAKSKYQTREVVFHQISKPVKIAENARRGVSDILTQFKVFDIVLKQVCRVFHATFSKKVILDEKLKMQNEDFFIRYPEMSRFMMSLRKFGHQSSNIALHKLRIPTVAALHYTTQWKLGSIPW